MFIILKTYRKELSAIYFFILGNGKGIIEDYKDN